MFFAHPILGPSQQSNYFLNGNIPAQVGLKLIVRVPNLYGLEIAWGESRLAIAGQWDFTLQFITQGKSVPLRSVLSFDLNVTGLFHLRGLGGPFA